MTTMSELVPSERPARRDRAHLVELHRAASAAPAPGARPRVAVLADAREPLADPDGPAAHLRDHGVPGYDLDLIGLAGAHPGLHCRPAGLAGALRERPYDLVHLCEPSRWSVAALPIARSLGLPVAASIHTELPDDELLADLQRGCRTILSPSSFADQRLRLAGATDGQIVRWDPGVDLERFNPACSRTGTLTGGRSGSSGDRRRINVVFAGGLTAGKGVGLLADAFLLAHERDPRLHLVLAGSGPEEDSLRGRLGAAATFLGRLDPDGLARTLASADLFVLPSACETCGQTVLEAQASGLPVLAVDAGGAAELVENGRSGFLVEPAPAALAEAMRWLARRATLRERLATGGLLAVRGRTWERSLAQLAAGWSAALARTG
jgi:glycosyltransferase involved in cell wall biosynthesis